MKKKESVRVRWKNRTHRKKQGYRYVRNKRSYLAGGKKYVYSEDSDSNDHTEEAPQQAMSTMKKAVVLGVIESVGVVRRCCNIKNRFGYISTNYTRLSERISLAGLVRQYAGGNKMSIWKWIVGEFSVMACICVTVMMFLGMMITASPFSILFCDEINGGAEMSLQQVMELVEQEFLIDAQSKIEALEADKVVLDTEGGALIIENWDEILAVFAVRNGIGQRIIMDQERIELLRDTVFHMVTMEWREIEAEEDISQENIIIAYVSMDYKGIGETCKQYEFTRMEEELAKILLNVSFQD